MPFVTRDGSRITGVFNRPQPGVDSEWVSAESEEVIAFLNPEPVKTGADYLAVLTPVFAQFPNPIQLKYGALAAALDLWARNNRPDLMLATIQAATVMAEEQTYKDQLLAVMADNTLTRRPD